MSWETDLAAAGDCRFLKQRPLRVLLRWWILASVGIHACTSMQNQPVEYNCFPRPKMWPIEDWPRLLTTSRGTTVAPPTPTSLGKPRHTTSAKFTEIDREPSVGLPTLQFCSAWLVGFYDGDHSPALQIRQLPRTCHTINRLIRTSACWPSMLGLISRTMHSATEELYPWRVPLLAMAIGHERPYSVPRLASTRRKSVLEREALLTGFCHSRRSVVPAEQYLCYNAAT